MFGTRSLTMPGQARYTMGECFPLFCYTANHENHHNQVLSFKTFSFHSLLSAHRKVNNPRFLQMNSSKCKIHVEFVIRELLFCGKAQVEWGRGVLLRGWGCFIVKKYLLGCLASKNVLFMQCKQG